MLHANFGLDLAQRNAYRQLSFLSNVIKPVDDITGLVLNLKGLGIQPIQLDPFLSRTTAEDLG